MFVSHQILRNTDLFKIPVFNFLYKGDDGARWMMHLPGDLDEATIAIRVALSPPETAVQQQKTTMDITSQLAQHIDGKAQARESEAGAAPLAPLMRVLVTDDSRSSLAWMRSNLQHLQDVVIETSDDPELALAQCRSEQYDLLIIDYRMPKLSGIDMLRDLRAKPNYRDVPIVMVTSDLDREVRLEAIRAGATDFLNKPTDEMELQLRISNLLSLRRTQVQMAAHASTLAAAVEQATQEIVVREEEMIWQLARAIEMRDGGTGEHISRVAAISQIIASGLGLNAQRCRMIYLAAPLHDVGKIGVSDTILCKPGKLTDDEMAAMREHVRYGVEILERGSSELMRTARRIVGGHHERWDGKGYPNHIAGTDIPIEARIVAVADVFDALCSRRPYKPAWPLPKAFAEIVAGRGTQFDPDCVDVFEKLWPAVAEIAIRFNDTYGEDEGSHALRPMARNGII